MSASSHDHRLPGKPAPLHSGEGDLGKENFVWKRRGFLRGGSSLQERVRGDQHYDWQHGQKSKLKLS